MLKDFRSIPGKLNQILDKRQKFIFGVLLFLAVVLSVVETIGISAVMPFISVASNPDLLKSGTYLYVYNLLEFSDPNKFIITFGIVIIVFYAFRSAYNIFFSYFLNKFSFGTFRYFAARLIKIYLALPYRIFVQKSPSTFSQMITGEALNLSRLLSYLLHILSESFTVLLLYMFMVFVNWQITLVLTIILIAIVVLVVATLIRASKRLGQKRLKASMSLSKTIIETFRLFKFIKLKGNQDEIFNNLDDSAYKVSQAEIITNTLGTIPKNVLENIGFSLLIAVVCYILWRYDSAAMVIPVITMYALALYRILPATNRILQNLNALVYQQSALDKIYDDLGLETDLEDSAPLSFSNCIEGKNIHFGYLNGGSVINGVSFKINRGEKVAFTGESGSGKTTLVDIITGIFRPERGSLYVDNALIDESNILSWRSKIGYIPQNIYLFDGTVADNVSFGSKPDDAKIAAALKTARIWDFLETKEGPLTRVGEGGIQLSGGQQQRICIARALYNDPEILVLDEATSSLDDATEAQIMDEIYDMSGGKTLIIIAHRLSTVARCGRQFRIENGAIVSER